MPRVIAVCNQKGGVGKTSVATNLPVFLVSLGKKVLLVDMDPQANATFSLGFNPSHIPVSIYHSLLGKVKLKDILKEGPTLNFHLIPSSPDLAGATIELVNLPGREFKLKSILDEIKNNYDYVLIDTPPSLGVLTINALCSADEILIPVQCEHLDLEGLEQLLKTTNLIRENLGRDLSICGILLTMYSRRNRLAQQIAKELRRNFPGYILETVIPRSIVLAEAPRYQKTIAQFAPASIAAKAYRQLAEEIKNLKL